MVNICINVAHGVSDVSLGLYLFPFSAVKTVQTLSPADRSITCLS